MRRIQSLRVACLLPVLAGLFAAGCAEVVPGLNMPDVDEGVHVLEAPPLDIQEVAVRVASYKVQIF